jgi:hypothetical protein
MLLSCLVTLLGLSNIAFAQYEIFKVDISCQQDESGQKGEGWYDWYLIDGCQTEGDDRVKSLQRHNDVFGTGIDVEVGPVDRGYVSTRAGDGISNSTIHYSDEGDIDCGSSVLRLHNLDPETTYTVYTYHAWIDGNITSVTVEGADSNNVLNIPVVVDTTSDAELLADTDSRGEIQFTTDLSGSTVNITFDGCTRFNAFELWSETALPTASSPNPSGTDVCPEDVQLSWTPGGSTQTTAGHDVYFGTDINDVTDANSTSQTGLLYYSLGQDSNEYPEDGNPLLDLDLMTTYYWRVDEINDTNTWTGSIWSFTTEDGNARDPAPADGFVGLDPDANVLSWTPSCLATAQTVYFSTDFYDVNTMQLGAIEDDTLSGTDNSCPVGTLERFTTYYWRIKTTGGGDGEVWSFITGFGGLLLDMQFEGTLNDPLPATEPDSSSNGLDFTTYEGDGSLEYAAARHPTGTSVAIGPGAGLYRADNGETDPLRLAGWQYTIDMWAYLPAEGYTETEENARMIMVGKENGWRIQIHDPGQDDDIRWYHRLGGKYDAMRAIGILPEIFDEWVHITAVFDMTAQEAQKLYIDGTVVASGNDRATASADNNTPVGIGVGVLNPLPFSFDHYFTGRIDELRIWDIAFEPEMEFATQPYPPDGSRRWDPTDANLNTFTWKRGVYADKHDIYFGTSLDDVDENAIAYKPAHDGNSWTHGMGEFEVAKTYYWRVDEVNDNNWAAPGSPWTGQVWRFQTEIVELYDANIVVYYPLDGTSGDDVWDMSGNYFDAECDNAPHWEPDNGRYGGCMHFSMEWGRRWLK